MKRWTLAFAALAAFGLVGPSILDVASSAETKKFTLAFQGAPDFNLVTQVPVLNAIIGRKPDAILIAPTDKVQLVESLKKAVDAGIPVLTVDTFIGDGHYQTGSGDADFPLSYIASDNILG